MAQSRKQTDTVAVRHGRDNRIDGPIGEAYARYDSDPRANGIDDFEAFADAVEPLCRTKRLEDKD